MIGGLPPAFYFYSLGLPDFPPFSGFACQTRSVDIDGGNVGCVLLPVSDLTLTLNR